MTMRHRDPLTQREATMSTVPKPPAAYEHFVNRYPKIGQAWELIAQAGREGPLDEKTARLAKLAIAIGAMREGAIHANVRKAMALGVTRAEIDQIVALSASTLGLPSAVAVFSWIDERLGDGK
jgi:4-carboxymuconolactone decarboxylase